jgi:hypothetical protein
MSDIAGPNDGDMWAELRDFFYGGLETERIDDALCKFGIEEVAQFILSSEDFLDFSITCRPVDEEFGRRISDAIVRNSGIRRLQFGFENLIIWCLRDLVAWVGSKVPPGFSEK